MTSLWAYRFVLLIQKDLKTPGLQQMAAEWLSFNGSGQSVEDEIRPFQRGNLNRWERVNNTGSLFAYSFETAINEAMRAATLSLLAAFDLEANIQGMANPYLWIVYANTTLPQHYDGEILKNNYDEGQNGNLYSAARLRNYLYLEWGLQPLTEGE